MIDFRLTALLCSRLCHDLTGPVGAVSNGVELLSEESDAEMRRQSLELLAFSASETSRRLRFYRLAFGAAGGLSAKITLGELERTAADFFQDRKQDFSCLIADACDPEVSQFVAQLILNMVLLGGESLPRGGNLALNIGKKDKFFAIDVRAVGKNAGLREEDHAALRRELEITELDARTVQPYFVAVLAGALEGNIEIVVPGRGEVRLQANIFI